MIFNFMSRYGKKDHGPKKSDISKDYETDFSDVKPNSALTFAKYDAIDTATHLGKFFFHASKFAFYAIKSLVQFVAQGISGIYDKPYNLEKAAENLMEMTKDAAHAADSAVDTISDVVTITMEGIRSASPIIATGATKAISNASDYLFPAKQSGVIEIEMKDMTDYAVNVLGTDDVTCDGA